MVLGPCPHSNIDLGWATCLTTSLLKTKKGAKGGLYGTFNELLGISPVVGGPQRL